MEPEKKVDEPVVEDESALDAELDKSLNEVRAGNTLVPETPIKPEKKEEGAMGQTGASGPEKREEEDPSKPPVVEKKEEGYEFRIPNKGKFESDESYELRIGLLDLVKKRKAATTPEAKQQLSAEIAKTKGQLKALNGSDRINNLNNVEKLKVDEDPALVADRERLKELGGATKDDIQEVIRQERFVGEQKSTLESFVSRHPELKDEDVREVFFGFVDSNYNWADKSGKDLMTVLELARENMFKPSETIQERVLKGANVQEKVNAMQFPGGTGGKTEFSPEVRKSIDELKATGMSEEKAVELISD
jgi:hypothetical protein